MDVIKVTRVMKNAADKQICADIMINGDQQT